MDAMIELIIYAALAIGTPVYLVLTRKEAAIQAKMIWAKIRKKSLKKVIFIGQDKTVKTKYEFPDTTKNNLTIDKQDYTINQESMLHDIDRNMQAVVILGGGQGVVNPLGTGKLKTKCPHCEKELTVTIPKMTSRLDPQFISALVLMAKMEGMKMALKDIARNQTLLYIIVAASVIGALAALMAANNHGAVMSEFKTIEALLEGIKGVVPT